MTNFSRHFGNTYTYTRAACTAVLSEIRDSCDYEQIQTVDLSRSINFDHLTQRDKDTVSITR